MIDWDRVRELRAEIGADDFDEVVAMFLEEADEAVGRLSPSLSPPAMEAALHYLKGAALNLGFATLSSLCQEAERKSAVADPSVDVEGVKVAYHASKAAFQTDLAQALAA